MAKVLISSFKLHLVLFNFFELGSIKSLIELKQAENVAFYFK
jgi:hypothetical protein